MRLRQFRPDLWLTELTLDDFDVRGAVLVGKQRVLVWDTLSHPDDMRTVPTLADGKPIYVVYSHADWDHCWGTRSLNPALIIAHDLCARRFRDGDVAQTLSTKKATSGAWNAVQLIPPTLTFTHSLTLDLGDITVELHHLPGHTADCLVAFIPQWGVLLAGDTIETPLPYLNEDSIAALPHWISELERWEQDQRVQVIIPAHGALGDRALATGNIRYLRDLRAGNDPQAPPQMSTFYADTHAKNLKLVQYRDK